MQVHINMNGYDIQTSLDEYKAYYKRIGWDLVGKAPALPGLIQEQSDAKIQEAQSKQGKLL